MTGCCRTSPTAKYHVGLFVQGGGCQTCFVHMGGAGGSAQKLKVAHSIIIDNAFDGQIHNKAK